MRRVGLLLRRHGWLIIGLLWIVALILGYLGFDQNAKGEGKPYTPFDIAYRVLQLMAMGSGDPESGLMPLALNVARFLMPALAAATAIRALLGLFRDRWQQFHLRTWRDHVIICGLSRKGWLLAQGFVRGGDRVVLIESNKDHHLIGQCRERRIAVLVGDATDPDLLIRAGLQRARHLVAVTDDDGVNAEIAVRSQGLLRDIPRRRPYPLTCTVHLVDPQLNELARTRELSLEEAAPLRVEFFNVFERGARLMWSKFGPARGATPSAEPRQTSDCSVHVLVVGLGRLGESLVVAAGRDWHMRQHEGPCGEFGRLRITVVDREADWKCRVLIKRYPKLADVCDLIPQTMNVRWPEFYAGDFLSGLAPAPGHLNSGYPAVSTVFICFDDDSLSLRTGLVVQQRLVREGADPAPVVVRMAEAGGLARLIDPSGDGQEAPAFANLNAFGLLDRTCTPEAILGGTHEVLARGLHDAYFLQQKALGHTAESNPSLVDWEVLPDALRESNRAEADGILRHLAQLGYTLVPLSDWDAAFFTFADPEVERLAISEHDRFVAERARKGWRNTSGPKDVRAKRSPALLPWSELPDEERSKTIHNVRALPATLARAGFQIVRAAPSPAAAGAQHDN